METKINQISQIDVVLIGYENQENLGLRSIMAYLLAQGYRVELVSFARDRYPAILNLIKEFNPRLIGFSIIFQFAIDEFAQLAHYLREQGIKSHFTAGGHFPSLCPKETLELLPDLDSVVRFEGELTLAELLENLEHPQNWGNVQGLAFRQGSELILTEPRPLIQDLDSLPLVYRDKLLSSWTGVPMASMLASRGCLFNCSFCSIRQFYGGAKGKLRRSRSPQAVVDEMADLFYGRNVRYFYFQDDDFAARTTQQRKWLNQFIEALQRAQLADKISWKISCRVDDLDEEILEPMLDCGLMAVYLGVESGSQRGLQTLNKFVTVEQNLVAINLLKRYHVATAIGFMMFDPSSNVQTVRENIAFLRSVGTDGYFPINFCKMLPYAGTPIERELLASNRLKGSITRPDYDFLDPIINDYSFLVQQIFTRRNFTSDGLLSRLQQADFEYRLAKALQVTDIPDTYEFELRHLIKESNELALNTLEVLLNLLVEDDIDRLLADRSQLLEIAEREWRGETETELALDALLMQSEIAPYHPLSSNISSFSPNLPIDKQS